MHRRFLIVASASLLSVAVGLGPSTRAEGKPFLQVLEQSTEGVSLRVRIPHSAVQIGETAEGRRTIRIPGLSSTLRPGQPELPVLVASVGVPDRAGIELTYTASDELELPGPPVQPVSRVDTERGGRIRETDPSIYSRRTPWPESPVVFEVVRFRGLRIARLLIYPARFNPATDRILLTRAFDIRLDFAGADAFRADRGGLGRVEENLARRLLLNRETVLASRASQPPVSPRTPVPATKTSATVANPAVKVRVDSEGVVRVGQSELQAIGFDPDPVDPRNLELSYRGNVVPCRVTGEDDGSFDAGDAIEFYGVPGSSRFSRENVYWIEESTAAGLRFSTRDATPGSAVVVENIPQTEHYEQGNSIYSFGMPASEGDPHFFWIWFENNPNPPRVTTFSHSTPLPGLAPGGEQATFRALFSGRTDPFGTPDHQVRFFVNGAEVGETTWSGRTLHTAEIPFDAGLLIPEGNNVFRLDYVSVAIVDQYYLDWIEVEYPRATQAGSDRLIVVGEGDTPRRYDIGGFASAADPLVLDVSDPFSPVALTGAAVSGAGPITIAFEEPAPAGKRYVVAGDGGRNPAVGLELDNPSGLKDPANGADLIIVVPEGWESTLQPLADLREAQGLRVALVNLTDVADEFSGGNVDDQAIRDFVAHAYENWQTPVVSHLLLVGDPNVDVLNELETPGFSHVMPTHLTVTAALGETMSDTWFGAVAGDDLLPDINVGRFSVPTVEGAATIVDKIVTYETDPPGPFGWTRRMLHIASDEVPFEESLNSAAQYRPGHFTVTKEYRRLGATTESIRTAFTPGATIVSFVGHGNVNLWADNHPGGTYFRTGDVFGVITGGRLPFVTALNCLNGLVGHPTKVTSMAEAFVSRGAGALAMWSPSSLGFLGEYNHLQSILYRTFFEEQATRLGATATSALVETYLTQPIGIDLVKEMVFVGDPASWLALDVDNDLLIDFQEIAAGLDPRDRDTDDDGLLDNLEGGELTDTDGDGIVNGLDPDSDNDGLLDGMETGIVTPDPDTDVSRGYFRADQNPGTKTNPRDDDSDNGGSADGAEDRDADGAIDASETNPKNAGDDPTCDAAPEIAAQAGDYLTVEPAGDNDVQLTWGDIASTNPCVLYRVYVADGLDSATGRDGFRLLTVTGLPEYTHRGAALLRHSSRYLVVGATLAHGEGPWGHFDP